MKKKTYNKNKSKRGEQIFRELNTCNSYKKAMSVSSAKLSKKIVRKSSYE